MSPSLPGSPEELAAYARIQARLPDLFRRVALDHRLPNTVVVVPSLSLDQEELNKVSGVHHYEERLLYMLMLLRRPRTRLVFVTSNQLDPSVVDYYLHLLSGVPTAHARRRLTLLHCGDSSPIPLTAKILARPRLQERIREAVGQAACAHMACFNSTPLERSLAVRLDLPLYANDPSLADLGTKSGCREIFRAAGVTFPDGFERLRDAQDIARALAVLKLRHPDASRAVVKLNEGFSGEGNALFLYEEGDTGSEDALARRILDRLPTSLRYEAPRETWDRFIAKYREMQGVVELFIEGQHKRSPSSQNRVNALGVAQVISTHDQVLGGPSGQVFEGCTFPADPAYRLSVQEEGLKVARELASRGVMGRFATDFVSVPSGDPSKGPVEWTHHAIEVNLRKGGTTHPFLTLRFLTDGEYDPATGDFLAQNGTPKCYFASDTLQQQRYVGLLPEDLIDISVYHGLHFHGATERGVVFHLMGALSEYGKLGVVCIGDNLQQARFLYKRTTQVLDEETGGDAP